MIVDGRETNRETPNAVWTWNHGQNCFRWQKVDNWHTPGIFPEGGEDWRGPGSGSARNGGRNGGPKKEEGTICGPSCKRGMQ